MAQHVKPSDGGCWFCHTTEAELFSIEFDANVHEQCIHDTLKEEPEHPEALIMAEEFNLDLRPVR